MLTGTKRGGFEHRIALYADDVVHFLCNLEISIPPLLGLIKEFGYMSGYKITNSKSSLVLLDARERTNPPSHVQHLITSFNEAFRLFPNWMMQ